MQVAIVALLTIGWPSAVQAASSPIGKVLGMLSDLQAQIVKEGEVVQKEYAAYAEMCEDRSRNLGFEIKTGRAEGEELNAAIAADAATIGSLTSKIDDLTAAVASNEKDLKAAGAIRAEEAADFVAEEKNLKETIGMLARATRILERQSGGASMAQLSNVGDFAQALDTMVRASMIGTGDAAKLTAFAQESDDDEAPGAPAGAVYVSQGGGIIDTLQDLSEKAESQLAEIRKKEVAARHNYEMLRQSLTDEIAAGSADVDDAKAGVAEASENKVTASGDLGVSSKELAEDVEAKGSLHQACLAKATDFEAETRSRGEELAALAKAKAIIEEAISGAALDQVSFVQRSLLISGRDLHHYEAVRLIRDLAHKHHSGALVQLASQLIVAMHASGSFDKVKGLISDMLAKLEKEAGADATKKAFCDKELAESNAKKSDKSDEITKLGTKIDQLSAKSAQLKEEVASLQTELSKLAGSQAEMDQLRQGEKATFAESKAELEKGIAGIKAALKVLSDYYAQDGKAHGAAEGSGGGIISLLEVVEADFSKNLFQITSDEEGAIAEHEQVSKENEIEKTGKEQDAKYKNQESTQLDKTSAELNADRSGVQAEVDAVQEYLTGIEGQCIAKAESYASRKTTREAEIAGLKEALQILENETALVQRRMVRKQLRGGRLSISA